MRITPENLRKCIPKLFLSVTGDIANITCWTNKRGRIVTMKKSPPTTPPSEAQRAWRAKFKFYHTRWMTKTADEKADWEDAMREMAYVMTGKNYYLHVAFTDDLDDLETVRVATNRILKYP